MEVLVSIPKLAARFASLQQGGQHYPSEKAALLVALTAGQCGDAPVGEVLLERVCTLAAVQTVCADRAFDSDRIRAQLKAARKRAAIPPTRNRRHQYRYAKTTTYKQRNRVERLINRLKAFRALATRYEKLARMFLGLVSAALIVLNL